MKELMQINNFIDLDVLQNILDNFSKSTGFAAVTVDYRGEPVTKTSGFTEFCTELRKCDEHFQHCKRCDAHGGLHAAIEGKPHVYRCHCGLVDFAVPLMVDGSYLGAILGGQAILPPDEDSKLSCIVDQQTDWHGDKRLEQCHANIQKASYEKVYSTAMLLHEIANYIVEKAYISLMNEQLNDKNMQLMQEENTRIELQNSLKEAELKALYNQINPDFLFNVLNTAARLAYIENAKQTEDIIYAFSDMMRYTLKREKSHLVTLEDELTHTQHYLRIQKMRMRDRITFEVNIPEEFLSVSCPFMTLQPIVENSVIYAVEPRAEGGTVSINCREDGEDLIIEIRDDGCGMSGEKIQGILVNNEYKNDEELTMGLFNINRRLTSFFGKNYGLKIRSLDEESEGTLVEVRLPNKRGAER